MLLPNNLSKAPRGIRNNNPGNIRFDGSTQWRGMIGDDSAGFIQFERAVFGIRAMTRILSSYSRRGVNTIGSIIATWAPPVENNTSSYINSVAKKMGMAVDDLIFEQHYPELIAAIIHHENGQQPYSLETIKEGISLA